MAEPVMHPKQPICGLGVTTEQLANCKGYILHLDNETDQELSVEFDFTGSENLELQDKYVDGIKHDGLKTIVKVPAKTVDNSTYAIHLGQIDPKKGVALSFGAAPPAEEVVTPLECGVIMKTNLLAGCQGYKLLFDNPTSEDMTLEFDFAKSDNLSVVPQGSTTASGMTATVSVASKAVDSPFVVLQTVDPSKPIAMEYNLASYPTKEVNPERKEDPLKCGVDLILQPLPKAGGYEFSFKNPTSKRHTLRFDFAKSDNLKLEGFSAEGVEIVGTTAKVVLEPNAETRKCFHLVSVDKAKGVQMNYALQSQTEELQ